jgi:hypothetical protein
MFRRTNPHSQMQSPCRSAKAILLGRVVRRVVMRNSGARNAEIGGYRRGDEQYDKSSDEGASPGSALGASPGSAFVLGGFAGVSLCSWLLWASPRSAFVLGSWLADPRATRGQGHHPELCWL